MESVKGRFNRVLARTLVVFGVRARARAQTLDLTETIRSKANELIVAGELEIEIVR